MDVVYSMNSKEFRLQNDKELMQALSWITSGALMEVFLSPRHHKSLPNVPTATLGGKQLWDSLWAVDGWQIQKCRVLGSLMPRYRILDPKGGAPGLVSLPQRLYPRRPFICQHYPAEAGHEGFSLWHRLQRWRRQGCLPDRRLEISPRARHRPKNSRCFRRVGGRAEQPAVPAGGLPKGGGALGRYPAG